MATEQFANSAQTTLASSVGGDPGDLSIAVVITTGFPSTPQFRIQIGNELLMVTALAGTTWTVTRGIEFTSRTPHSAGEPVTQVFTAGAVNTLVPDQTGNSGKFLTTDGNNTSWVAGPNNVTTSTTTDLTGYLTGVYPPESLSALNAEMSG